MLINRNNYESFFLLYVDGELCAAEVKMVEDFAAANKDLSTELEMLKAAVLPIDEILFEDKGELYKPIGIDSLLYEKLLLQIDNELPENEIGSLNKLITSDENVRAEMNLLQRTKLHAAESIVFADKHLLYRKERDNVVVGRFARWAAAAVLLGFGFYFGANLIGRRATPPAVSLATITTPPAPAGIQGAGTPDQPIAGTNTAASTPKDNNTADASFVDKSTGSPTTAPATQLSHNSIAAAKSPVDNNTGSAKKTGGEDAALNTATPQANAASAIVREQGSVPRISNNEQPPIAVISPKEIKLPAQADNSVVPLENPYANAVVLTDNDKSNNKIFYMDEDDVRRSKAGGIFKKVKRFVERTAKVKTGNTLRIAGFAIASK